jgi:hypothetical protein
VDVAEVRNMMDIAAAELEDEASKEIEALAKDKQLQERLNEIKKFQNNKEGEKYGEKDGEKEGEEDSSSQKDENESDEEADKIVKQLMDEAKLENLDDLPEPSANRVSE